MNIFNKFLCFLMACSFTSAILAADVKPLILATEATYPPFESVNNQGEMIGFDIDILKAVCSHIQRTCKFVNQPWDSLIPGLRLGKFDVIFGSMNITEERLRQVDFTQPYYTSTGTFIAAKKQHFSLTPQSLDNKTIGVQGSTTYDYYLQDVYGRRVRINRYGSIQDAFLDLQSGRIDLVFGDTPIMISWANEPANSALYAPVGDPVKDERFFNKGDGFAVKKGNKELLDQLNKGLEAIKADGTYQKIIHQYFGKS